jgi:NAD binding domain of 6-phosphogluconate dehydrogenase
MAKGLCAKGHPPGGEQGKDLQRATAHIFRYSFTGYLLQANYGIRTIQELLGLEMAVGVPLQILTPIFFYFHPPHPPKGGCFYPYRSYHFKLTELRKWDDSRTCARATGLFFKGIREGKMDRIGFLGLGTMGLPMAVNMARAGFQLTVWNRTPGKAGPVLEAGAVEADSPAALLDWADTAVMLLSGSEAVDDALTGLVEEGQGLLKGKILVNMGTNPQTHSGRPFRKRHVCHQSQKDHGRGFCAPGIHRDRA